MKLVEIQRKAGNKIFCFTNTKNDGFILESIKIHINKNRIIQQIDIQELKFGFCSFGLQGELFQCEAWESEEEAQSISNLSRHYTTISANDKKGYAYAKKIYRSLDKTLEDNYLRFILKDFIFQKRVLKFEEKYYSIYSPPKEEVVENNSYTSQEKESIEILSEETPIKRDFLIYKIKKPLLIGGLVILFLFLIYYFNSLLFQKRISQPEWDNPANWTQPTKDDLYLSDFSVTPNNYIYRKRDYEKILNTPLFPTLPLVEKTISEAILDYTQKSFKVEQELQRQVPKMTYADRKEFFDKIYKLDKEDQVIIFHNEFIKQGKSSNFELAEMLETLYKENLIRLLYTYSSERIIFVSDFMEAQANKNSLIGYLFLLVQKFPNTELSIEAFLILEDLFEIQERGLDTLFGPSTSNFCETKNYKKMENPLERMVCLIYKKNKFFDTDYPEEKTKLKYDLFRESILDYALTNNKNKYRVNDIRFKLMILLLSGSKNEKALENFYSITPENNYGKFLSKENYYAVKKILQENQAGLKSLNLLSKYKKDLRTKQIEITGLENKIASLGYDVNKLTTKILLERDNPKSLEKRGEREKHLLYMER